MQKSDFYSWIWLVVLYAYLILISNFVPQGPGRSIAGFGGLFIIVAGIFFQDLVFIMMTNPYPYIRAFCFPSGKVLRFFIDKDGIEERKPELPGDFYPTTLHLKYPTSIKGYGQKVKSVDLTHEGRLFDRIAFQPGYCNYMGYECKHPMVASCVLYEYPLEAIDIDYAARKPVFHLFHAAKDYFRSPIPVHVAELASGGNQRLNRLISNQAQMIISLKHKNAELEKQEYTRHSQNIRDDKEIKKQESEIEGLVKGETHFMQDVVAHCHIFRTKFRSFDEVVKHFQGSKWTFNKYMAFVIIGAGALALVWAMRGYMGEAGAWLNSPVNMAFGFAVIIVVALFLYYLLVRRRQ